MNPVDPRIDPALVPPGSRAVVIAEHQGQFLNLPSVRTPPTWEDGKLVRAGYVVTRWELTERERADVAAGQDLFITIVTSGAIHPMLPTVGPIDWRK